ncbi:DUF1796 family putative cysteine peptidase [Cohnella sp. JJ-181]|uniref:DUF1796 family putative cysteine peptidase n=1 Tax=Cohnella rhizoplanae TaxID=2974897 RepID=UPI0022FFB57C|nr:DUF1796 family putative cysteine peptidase [Cohnella sp. JJ-181]CAI6032562.1 hypothetical protein COHCIP112018_00762 [Cohnella sp. JJ-181]
MRLADIKGNYDGIFSLGHLCLTAIQLERNGLRPFAGPIDWMASYTLPDVSRFIRNRCAGFMERGHLQYECTFAGTHHLVRESAYNFILNHDFFASQCDPYLLETYPYVKTKYDKQRYRLLERAANGKRLLFVRCGGTFEEVRELRDALNGFVTRDYNLLHVSETDTPMLRETEWPLARVCSVELPGDHDAVWIGNHAYWQYMLNGINYMEPE